MFEHLPAELVLHVAEFLSATEILRLGSVSRRLKGITSDKDLWRRLCFRESHSTSQSAGGSAVNPTTTLTFQVQAPSGHATQNDAQSQSLEQTQTRGAWSRPRRHSTNALSRWDKTTPDENLDWHSDYIGRHAQLNLDWLSHAGQEAKGLGVIDGSKLVVPLDDGSLRIWDVNAEGGSYGRMIDQSYPGALFPNANTNEGKALRATSSRYVDKVSMSMEAVVEGVSIDCNRKKAYIAFGSGLSEVDLTTFQVSTRDQYPEDISVLSQVEDASPLTVGTSKALYIYDPRTRPKTQTTVADIKAHMKSESTLYRIVAGDPDYAPLSQPLPLSIVHQDSHYIHVAGRFPSILNYDRRAFPRVQSTVYSGARLSCLTSMPSSTGNIDLVAAGDYNGKGSIEIYPLDTALGTLRREHIRNRTSASRSKCLSLVSHGSRLLFSDSDGMVKWVERDASSLVRRWNINEYDLTDANTQSAQQRAGIFNAEPGNGDVARRMIPLNASPNSDVAIWTGEKIGIMSFGARREVSGAAKDDDNVSGSVSDEERDYGRMMRRALEKQADEVRFVRNMGLGRSF